MRARLYVAPPCQGSLFNLALFSSPALCWGGCEAAIVPAAQERPGRNGRSPSAGRRSLSLRSLFLPAWCRLSQQLSIVFSPSPTLPFSPSFLSFCGETGS